MTTRITHNWNLSPKEAIQLQQELKTKVKIEPLTKPIQYIAGADISFNRGEDTVYVGIVVLKYPELIEVDRVLLIGEATFPYIPGLLSFRESPLLIKAWEKLRIKPDVIVADGHGIAHIRRFGIACHLGLLTDTATIGCAKKIFVGTHGILEEEKGSIAQICYKEETVGVVLRTRKNVKPVYISAGHKITLEQAIEVMNTCTSNYRIPVPTRQAHLIVNELRRGELEVE
ncbi:MAG: deoxyribonuclease V [Chitinophagales bacterium]